MTLKSVECVISESLGTCRQVCVIYCSWQLYERMSGETRLPARMITRSGRWPVFQWVSKCPQISPDLLYCLLTNAYTRKLEPLVYIYLFGQNSKTTRFFNDSCFINVSIIVVFLSRCTIYWSVASDWSRYKCCDTCRPE